MSQSANPTENQAVHAIDSLFYLILTRLLVVLIPFIAVVAVVRYQAVQAVNCNASCVGANLSGRDLHGSNLSYADMVEADLQFSNLNGANLAGADLSGANLTGVSLQNADLRGASLIGADLSGANLRNANLEDTQLQGANLSRADLTRADLTRTQLDGATLVEAKLVEANLQGVNLSGMFLSGSNFTGANLNRATLNGSTISNSNFSGCSMVNTELNGLWANLTNLTGADMTGASIAGTSLVGSNLTSVNLTNATLVGSIFIGARLNGAILSGANLTGARLFLAEMQPTTLNIDPALATLNALQKQRLSKNADLSGITFNSQTIWPAGKITLLAGILGSDNMMSNMEATTEKEQSLTKEALQKIDMGRIQLPLVEPAKLTGLININGSSSIYPLTNVLAQGFKAQGFRDAIKIGELGTGIGIKGFCEPQPDNPIDIVAASRLMKADELALCRKNKVHPLRLTIGLDAMAILVNPTNETVSNLTNEQMPLLFTAENWSNIDPAWPPAPILRFTDSPGSGVEFLVSTLLNGNEDNLINAPNITFGSNADIVLGVASNQYALGFTGYTYYRQNSDTMKLVSINGIYPSNETVSDHTYPLVRPLYLYTDVSLLEKKPQVAAFLSFYLTYVNAVVEKAGYFPLPPQVLDEQEFILLRASALRMK